MTIAMQVGQLTERFASATLLIGERDEYMICVGATHATIVHDPNNAKRDRSSRMNVGKTFHDGTGRGTKESQIVAHYKRYGGILADAVREVAAMMTTTTTNAGV